MTPTYRHATIVSNNALYIIGGYTSGNPADVPTRTIYSGTVVSDSIESWKPVTSLPITISDFSAELVYGRLYIIGGKDETGSLLSDIYRITVESINNPEAWERIGSLEKSVFEHGTAVSELGEIYLIGGQTESSFSSEAFYTPLALLTKSHDPQGEVTYNDTITYSLWYTTNVIRDLPNVTITDSLPANTEYMPDSFTSTGSLRCPMPEHDLIACQADLLLEGDTGHISFQVRVVPEVAASAGLRSILPDWFVTDLPADAGQPPEPAFTVPGDSRTFPASLAPLSAHTVSTDTVSPACIQPVVFSVHPAAACDDVTTAITIEGTDFAPTPSVRLGDLALPDVTFLSASRLTATIPAHLPHGVYSLTVTNPGGLADTLPDAVTVVRAAFDVRSVQPTWGANDRTTTITVMGENFQPVPTLSLEGHALTNVVYLSSTAVTAQVPPGISPGYYELTVTNAKPCRRSVSVRAFFTVTRGAFWLSEVTPTIVCDDERTAITITGGNFPPEPIVHLNDTPLEITDVTTEVIDAIVPGLMPSGSYSLTVSGDGPCDISMAPPDDPSIQAITPDVLCWYSRTLTQAITVLERAISVTDFVPRWALNTEETLIDIFGSHFRSNATASLNATTLTVVPRNSEWLQAIVPAGFPPGDYALTVKNPGRCECQDTAEHLFRVVTDEPVIVRNVAYLCIDQIGCIPSDTVWNTPYRAYLPLVSKAEYSPEDPERE